MHRRFTCPFFKSEFAATIHEFIRLIGSTICCNDANALPCPGRPIGECVPASVEILNAVGLGDRLDYKSYELSGRQQQRVSIARARVNKPRSYLPMNPARTSIPKHPGIPLSCPRN